MKAEPGGALHRDGSIRPLVADRGSFRDRANRVYDDGERIVRGLNAEALTNWHALEKERFFQELVEERKVVATALLPPDGSVARLREPWAGWLVHERIPFVTYPYEWCFGMLKDAALLYLDVLERALAHGWSLKDGSAYNVQFIGSRPIFIDVPTFTRHAPGEPWVGYRQFCMMFLYPLMLRAYRGIDYLPLLRGNLEGVEPETASQILAGWTRLRKGVFGHVYLHAKMQSRYKKQDLDQARTLTEEASGRPEARKGGSHSPAMLLGMIQGLRRTVEALRTSDERTTWGDYECDHSYAEASFETKKAFVERIVKTRRWGLAWDLGCNTGTFSKIAASNAEHVVAIDGDAGAIERLYQRQKRTAEGNILPLVMNIGNASPGQGWRGMERRTLEARGRPDLILCLALVHHIVISANIPLQEFVAWLRDLDSEVVLESVGLRDAMTLMLLRNRVNQYEELEDGNFEKIISAQFDIAGAEPLKGGTRTLYHLRPR